MKGERENKFIHCRLHITYVTPCEGFYWLVFVCHIPGDTLPNEEFSNEELLQLEFANEEGDSDVQ